MANGAECVEGAGVPQAEQTRCLPKFPSPCCLPKLLEPSSTLRKAAKWDFEWQDPVVASILTPTGGDKKKRQGVGRIISSSKSKSIMKIDLEWEKLSANGSF